MRTKSYKYPGYFWICLITAIGLLYACGDQQGKTDDIDLIKSTFQVGGNDTILKKQEVFNAQGQLIALYTFGSRKNDTVQRTIYIYDQEGLKAVRVFDHNKLLREELHTTIGGRTMRVITMQAKDTVSVSDYTYFPTGTIKRMVVQYGYDASAPITVVTNYNAQGETESIYKQIYEDSTRVVLSRLEMDKFVHTYNEAGQLVGSNGTFTFGYHEAPDSILNVTYQYDAQGRLIKTHHKIKGLVSTLDSIRYAYPNGMEKYRIEYHTVKHREVPDQITDTIFSNYDEKGRLVFERSTMSGRTFLYTYQQK